MDQPIKKAKPCKDRYLLMPETAQCNFKVCERCGWKEYDPGWHLRPVKLDNRFISGCG